MLGTWRPICNPEGSGGTAASSYGRSLMQSSGSVTTGLTAVLNCNMRRKVELSPYDAVIGGVMVLPDSTTSKLLRLA